MSDRIIKIPKMHHELYEEARRVKAFLRSQGLDRSLFDIMNELLTERKKNKGGGVIRWRI